MRFAGHNAVFVRCDYEGTYQQSWDDCLDAVVSILQKAKDFNEAIMRVDKLHVLVRAKKFEQIKSELGVIEGSGNSSGD
jgi:hypothetical protein